MQYNAFSIRKKNPKIAQSPRDYITPPEKDRATTIGNVQKTYGKNCASGSRDMLVDK